MKHYILLFTFISLSFTQTSLITNSDDSSFGFWMKGYMFDFTDNPSFLDPLYGISLDCALDSDVEIGLGLFSDESFELSIGYYPQNFLFDKVNFWSEFSISNMSHTSYNRYSFKLGSYTEDLLFFSLGRSVLVLDDAYTLRPNVTILNAGKIIRLKSFSLLLSYTCNIRKINKGWVSVELGIPFGNGSLGLGRSGFGSSGF
tara:strand:- start:2407 stop:3009 length:603 start_codon:yes stop_codon:yes gene_type:complete